MNFFGPVQTKTVYYYIAKCALWVIAVTLLGVFVSSIYLVLCGDRSVLGYVISSAQAMSFIAVSVMGYHLSGHNRNIRNEAAIAAQTEQTSDPSDTSENPDPPETPDEP